MSFEEPSSPARKRMRLSSPTYDELIDDFDDEGLEEINRIELTLSQKQFVSLTLEASKQCLELSRESKGETVGETRVGSQSAVPNERDNDHAAVKKPQSQEEEAYQTGASTSTRCKPHADDKYDRELSSSPQAPPLEPDYSSWFNSEPNLPLAGFQRASKSLFLLASEEKAEHVVGFVPGGKTEATNGFTSAAAMPDALLEPSKSALDIAARRLKEWAEEDEVADVPDAFQSPLAAKTKTVRPALASVSNASSFRPPLSTMQNPARSISTSSLGRVHAFRSPLVGQPSPQTVYPKAGGGSNENVTVRPSVLSSLGPSNIERPPFSAGASAFMTPARPSRPSGLSSLKRAPRSTFSTPFKPGMGPGEPGRIALEKAQQAKKLGQKMLFQKLKEQKERKDDCVKRNSLKECGLRPQRFSMEELKGMGVNASELRQITPQTAPFYVFYPDSIGQVASSSTSKSSFGPAEAHAHLQKTGRTHASRQWVDNQWVLVLWKLAGMACLEPQRETTPVRRWCWRSVLDQLEKRYDKEIGRGARPALRLITTQDAPAATPMVLLVTQVIWAEPRRIGPDGRVLEEAEAELEVSDGWYRLHASVDAPLARAVAMGVIKPGRKIAVAGAKLDNDRKEPSEIFEAYESCTLLFSGNGTHLAPWHAKLGFQSRPFIATLGSLTPDGGPVPLMDLVVEKVYPIAHIEFKTGPDGNRIQDGPHCEEEEAELDDKWQKLRDAEEAKVREELEARWGRWDSFADRLESCASAAAPQGSTEDDSPPDHIDDLFDELDSLPPSEVGPYIRGLAPYECIHLARFLRRKSARDKELAMDEIEVEMKHRCPPRNVSNFRVVMVRDGRTSRKPANRTAQLTIWDVLKLHVSEGGKAGAIEVGQRFLMTNLNPTQHRAWMGHKKDDTVYLATRKNTRFTRLE